MRVQIVETVRQHHNFIPTDYQIRTLQSLLERRRDTILYAGTGAGKSLIAQIYPILRPGWVLCIIPLTRLGDEQVNKINKIEGLKGHLLYDKTNTSEGREALRTALDVEGCTHST